jgi:catechol 2,3-dioxygenase-like lactoylglutathione lyase family enzyme
MKMPITLNHTIVPSRDKVAAAEFFARMFGLKVEPSMGHFAPVRVNDTLTLDFDNAENFERHHYAFKVSEEEFDAILGRVKAENRPYGSEPSAQDNMEINTRRGGRSVYFRDADGHSWELLTHG